MLFSIAVFLLTGALCQATEKFHEASKHSYDVDKMIDYYRKDPVTKMDCECFDKFKDGYSVDFVIDVAASPSLDKVDKWCAENPFGLLLEHDHRSPTVSYLKFINLFIDLVTLDMKPELTQSIIYNNGRKYFIKGRYFNDTLETMAAFKDDRLNLDTLWPVSTKSWPESKLNKILVNNLGRMTKSALWVRDNSLPIVLSSKKLSKKSIYTIVITDGASGAKIEDLTDDLSRTSVIDIGQRRFSKNLAWEKVRKIISLFSLPAPQLLPSLTSTVRNMACILSTHEN